jgi:putative two-component system response regulator
MLTANDTILGMGEPVWQLDRTIARSFEDKSREKLKAARILVIDDEPLILRVVSRFLQSNGFEFVDAVNDSRKALARIEEFRPDLILLDVIMPHMSGLDVLRSITARRHENHLPVIILSASTDVDTKREALALGATEFLSKPVDPNDLILRVRNALLVKSHNNQLATQAKVLEEQVYFRTEQLRKSREQIVHALAKAAEYRDNETGMHVIRVGKIAALLAEELGFGPEYCRQLELAAQLHDVGKIGIPDAILLTPHRLTPEQFAVMKQHCFIGCHIIDQLVDTNSTRELGWRSPQSPDEASRSEFDPDATLLALAANITLTHHERWDGAGYPNGIVGERIPIEGRITAVADVYDALTSKRPYKDPFSDSQSSEIINGESGKAFDPKIVEAFKRRLGDIQNIRSSFPDTNLPAIH